MYIALFSFSKKQMIQLQGVNKLFYKRVAGWIRVVIIFPTIRRSETVCIKPESTEDFVVFPSAAMMRAWRGVLHTLIGCENNEKGTGLRFNFILSNGTRSTQRDKDDPTDFTHMIPKDALQKIRSVTFHYTIYYIGGFSFFDKDGALLWKIGDTWNGLKRETVLLAENEVIVGVVAKLYSGNQSMYSDF